jgi:hypothetical protein
MTTNQLMTWGAIGFAAFALYYITRKPKPNTTQPGQQQRDAALAEWNAGVTDQWRTLGGQALGTSIDQAAALLKLPNPFMGVTS